MYDVIIPKMCADHPTTTTYVWFTEINADYDLCVELQSTFPLKIGLIAPYIISILFGGPALNPVGTFENLMHIFRLLHHNPSCSILYSQKKILCEDLADFSATLKLNPPDL